MLFHPNLEYYDQNLSSSIERTGRTLLSPWEFLFIVAVSTSTKDLDSTFGVWWPVTLFDLVNVEWPPPFDSSFVLAAAAAAPLLKDDWRLTLGRSSLVGKLEYWLGNESKHGEPIFLMSLGAVRFFMNMYMTSVDNPEQTSTANKHTENTVPDPIPADCTISKKKN